MTSDQSLVVNMTIQQARNEKEIFDRVPDAGWVRGVTTAPKTSLHTVAKGSVLHTLE